MTDKYRKPPKIQQFLLKFISSSNEIFAVIGDFEEIYNDIAAKKGKMSALRWYSWQILKSLPFGITQRVTWSFIMFKNYIIISLRNIKKYKGYSFINISGFAIGLSCCFLISLFVRHELSYDKYHKNAQNIYRVVREHQGSAVWYNSSEHPLAASLKEDFPEVVEATRVKKNDEVGVVEYNSRIFNEEGIYFVDQDFLEIFTFPFISGDKHTALKEPFSVLITERIAEKYFGNEEPLGKIVQLKDWYGEKKYNYTVKGVLKAVPENSHFTFDFLISYQTMYTLKSGGKEFVESWNYFEPKTYVKLESDSNPQDLEFKFHGFLKKYKGEESTSEKLHLQPLTDIHLGGNLRFELETNSESEVIYIFSAIAFLIILIACLNYINLSIASSAKRATEVGIRKVVGATKFQLMRQFQSESMFFTVLALIMALLVVNFVLPVFSSLLERNLTVNLFQDLDVLFVFIGFTILIGFLAGSYPAFFISSFHPIRIIKGTLQIGSKRLSVFRNSLVVAQFIITIVLIICTIVIHNQLSYIKNRNLGFDKEQIVTVYTMDRDLGNNSEPLKKELLQNPEILGVSVSLDLPTTIRRTTSIEWDKNGEKKKLELNYSFIDYDFLEVYDIEVLQGRNFSKDFSMDKEEGVIINETAAKNFGWETAAGKKLFSQGREWTVIGKIKDIHFKSLHWKIAPSIFLFYEGRGSDYFSIKISPANISASLAFIEDKWKKFSPDYPFQYKFLDERIDKIYRAEQKLGQSFNIFTLVALFIAFLGLTGLVSFVTEQKRKEIGIRKVLGANFQSIFVLLTREYAKCIVLSIVIACPIGYIFMNRWLQNFAYRTGIGTTVFILSGLFTFIFALIIISHHSIKAAIVNPADSLRSE